MEVHSNEPVPTKATVSYIKDIEEYKNEKPYLFTGALDPAQEHLRTNIVLEEVDNITLSDIRAMKPGAVTLETNALQLVKHKSIFAAALEKERALEQYLQETAVQLKVLLSAELVLSYNFKCRRSSSTIENSSSVAGTVDVPDQPVWALHIDFTEDAGLQRVMQTLNESEIRTYLTDEYRIRIINSWRPLHRAVENSPLIFCNPWTVEKKDLVAIDRPSLDQVSEAYYLKYNPLHKFFWCDHQTPDEIAFFTSWDSKPGESPPFCPHASARILGALSGLVERESIETRSVVITKVNKC